MLRLSQNYGAKLLRIILSLCVVLGFGPSVNAQKLEFFPSEPTGKITPSFTLYEDVGGNLDLSGYLTESIQQKRGDFDGGRGSFGRTISALWFETEITNVGSNSAEAIVAPCIPSLPVLDPT